MDKRANSRNKSKQGGGGGGGRSSRPTSGSKTKSSRVVVSKLTEHLPHGGKEGCDSCEIVDEQRKGENRSYQLDNVSKNNNQFLRFPELRN